MEFDLPDGETVELVNAADWIDPVIADDGTIRFAVLDEHPWGEYEFPDYVQFIQGNWRHLHYCNDPTSWMEEIHEDPTLDLYLVGVYEHGGIEYSLAGTSVYSADQFDYCVGAAIAIPNLEHEYGFTDTRETAKAILAEYTGWCNGECYVAVDFTKDPETGEWSETSSCSGYYGRDRIKDALKEGF